jgi:drug/metabolite transporter (DMT)-like permease
MNSSVLGFVCILITAILFGSIYSLAKLPLADIDPLLLSSIVYPIAFIAVVPIARASFRLDSLKEVRYIVIISTLGAVAAPLLLFYGLAEIDASDGAILANAQILFTILLSCIFFGERPRGLMGYGAIAIVSVGLLLASTELDISGSFLEYEPSKLMILGAMLCWALDNNLSRRLIKTSSISPSKIAMLKFMIGGTILFGLLMATQPFTHITEVLADLDGFQLMAIILLSVFGFAVALFFLLEGLKRIGTIKAMVALAFTPIVGIIIAMATRGELISPLEAIATVIITIGVLIVSKS